MFIEEMKPYLKWNNEYWNIENGKNLKDISKRIEYYSGKISNLILNIEKFDEKNLDILFEKFKWINKIMLIKDNTIVGVYQRI